jgi:protocatechuate 3,4-dioxygenase beta subunit
MKKQSGMSRRDVLGASIALPLSALAAPPATATPACGVTPAQTTGPFYPIYDQVDKDVDLTRLTGHGASAEGEVIRVQGRVLDDACKPIAGALVDLWQADANGRYGHPADPNPARRDANFQGWGQAVTDAEGRFSFKTIKPAAYPMEFLRDGSPDERVGYRTPHIHFRVSKRGYDELATQMYFAGEKLNDSDIVLRRVPQAERSKVVISPARGGASEPPVFEFDIALARV